MIISITLLYPQHQIMSSSCRPKNASHKWNVYTKSAQSELKCLCGPKQIVHTLPTCQLNILEHTNDHQNQSTRFAQWISTWDCRWTLFYPKTCTPDLPTHSRIITEGHKYRIRYITHPQCFFKICNTKNSTKMNCRSKYCILLDTLFYRTEPHETLPKLNHTSGMNKLWTVDGISDITFHQWQHMIIYSASIANNRLYVSGVNVGPLYVCWVQSCTSLVCLVVSM